MSPLNGALDLFRYWILQIFRAYGAEARPPEALSVLWNSSFAETAEERVTRPTKLLLFASFASLA
jgi:hypothetical protein